ncbi:hypothetical protein ACIOEW_17595 [Streptomyces sp. NPDC087901]
MNSTVSRGWTIGGAAVTSAVGRRLLREQEQGAMEGLHVLIGQE